MFHHMRTTVEFESDTAKLVEQVRKERGRGVSDAVNELIRRAAVARRAGLLIPGPGRGHRDILGHLLVTHDVRPGWSPMQYTWHCALSTDWKWSAPIAISLGSPRFAGSIRSWDDSYARVGSGSISPFGPGGTGECLGNLQPLGGDGACGSQ